MTDDQIFAAEADFGNAILGKLNAVPLRTPATQAVELLLGRIVHSGDSLQALRKYAPHNYAFDAATILRGIYDAMLQALYILVDPTDRDERGRMYLDYRWIEKWKAIEACDESPTDYGKRMSQSPRRAGGAEAAIMQEVDRVRPKFVKNSKGDVRNHWYEGSLRNLATDVGLVTEYNLLQSQLSGYVHSSSYALLGEVPIPEFMRINLAWRFSFRVLGEFAEYKQVSLADHEQRRIRLAKVNVFDQPKPDGR